MKTTKPTISKELREKVLGIMHLVGCQTYSIGCNQTKDNTDGLLEVERLENLTTDEILALIADQQRQLLDRVRATLDKETMGSPAFGEDTESDLSAGFRKGWNNGLSKIHTVINDIREGLGRG